MQSPVEYALIYGTPVPGYIAPAAVLSGGLAVVPDYSLGDVDAGTAPEPDVVVVPAVVFPAGRKERPLREWLARRAGRGALLAFSCRSTSSSESLDAWRRSAPSGSRAHSARPGRGPKKVTQR